ncbi:YitT family protein [Streptococcus pluranimalium]|uniref:YitT family protein n=1 Tax=Streptococcus hyovaginalis TaxID=149015 RepID=UPI00041E7622|nr:YitT family protein [Streptococcus hyovaginalis]MDY3025176.1 YitT family protein [Streptococcus hyovaginalis]MDY4510609.1 YitT family protein [Streptococcus hyovaginalis]MDY5973733.1 YitT family protein [Streptococcus hyovaginalis]
MTKRIVDFLFVTMGSLVSAIGFNTMFIDNNIASGGMIGIAVSFKELFGWSPSYFLLLINIPLLLICYIGLGRATLIKTLYGSWIFPLFIGLTEPLPTLTHDHMLAAIFGGVIVGFGLGMVFWGNSSTGGTGILTQVLHKYSPLSLAMAMLIVDGISVAMGLFAFPVETVMYSILALIIISYTVNTMEAGASSARNMMIVSSKYADIKKVIASDLDRGVTTIPIKGGYTDKDQVMLMTTISNFEVHRFEKAIAKIDPSAFVIITPASRVTGRGFSLTKDYKVPEEDIILPG